MGTIIDFLFETFDRIKDLAELGIELVVDTIWAKIALIVVIVAAVVLLSGGAGTELRNSVTITTAAPEPTATAIANHAPSPTDTATPTVAPTATPLPTAEATATATPVPTGMPEPTDTPWATPVPGSDSCHPSLEWDGEGVNNPVQITSYIRVSWEEYWVTFTDSSGQWWCTNEFSVYQLRSWETKEGTLHGYYSTNIEDLLNLDSWYNLDTSGHFIGVELIQVPPAWSELDLRIMEIYDQNMESQEREIPVLRNPADELTEMAVRLHNGYELPQDLIELYLQTCSEVWHRWNSKHPDKEYQCGITTWMMQFPPPPPR